MSVQLRIPKPCHEDWQNMIPDKDGRHCMACQKTVVDFSNMTDREILDYISKAGTDVCGRVDTGQLNRGLRENNLRKRFSLVYAWNLLIVLFMFAGKAKAQGKLIVRKNTEQKKSPFAPVKGEVMPTRTVNGVVKNAATGMPIPFASVTLKGSEQGTSADSLGKFFLQVPVWGHETELEISALGFEPATISFIDSDHSEQVCNLLPGAQVLDEVVVRPNLCFKRSVSGGLTYARSITIIEKVSREIDGLFPKKDVIIFPNPIAAGQNIQAALQLKEKGEYHLDLVDAGGKIVWMRTVQIDASRYNVSIPTERLWSAGIYWLRISARHTKKIYHGKIVLQ